MINYQTLVTANLNINYDRDLFLKEYDRRILPNARPVLNSKYLINKTKDYNQSWGMVDPEIYTKADVRDDQGKHIKQGYSSWLGVSMVYLDSDNAELRDNSKLGSVSIRNLVLDKHGEFVFFPQYEDLEITKFIKSLPLTSIIGVRCVSLDNSFALIHRDNSNYITTARKRLDHQPLVDNHLWKEGFVQVTINISDGNAPLYYCNHKNLEHNHLTINYPIYLFNDFSYHGVSVTSGGLRRQIRITGRPTKELEDFIESSTIINFKE
jgi:hypothetical protein